MASIVPFIIWSTGLSIIDGFMADPWDYVSIAPCF